MKLAEKKRLPKRLKKYRMDAGYSIYTFAEKLQVDPSTVSYWENGIKFPRKKNMMDLEDIFGVGYRELFSDLTEEEAEDLNVGCKSKYVRRVINKGSSVISRLFRFSELRVHV